MGWLLMFMPWVCPGSHRCGGIQKEKVPVSGGNQICIHSSRDVHSVLRIHHSVVSYPLRVRAEMGMWTGSDWPTCKTSLQPSIFRSMPLFLTTPNCRLWHGKKVKQVMQNAESILGWAIFPLFPVFFFKAHFWTRETNRHNEGLFFLGMPIFLFFSSHEPTGIETVFCILYWLTFRKHTLAIPLSFSTKSSEVI